jgi:hypothetical protein
MIRKTVPDEDTTASVVSLLRCRGVIKIAPRAQVYRTIPQTLST